MVCWAVVGTTTCVSKAIELWVTSNLRIQTPSARRWSLEGVVGWVVGDEVVGVGAKSGVGGGVGAERNGDDRVRGKRRKWRWGKVLKHCVAPPCAVYVVMAWALVLKREF